MKDVAHITATKVMFIDLVYNMGTFIHYWSRLYFFVIDLLIVIEVISIYLFDFYVSLARKATSCLLTRPIHECLRRWLEFACHSLAASGNAETAEHCFVYL